MVNGCAQSVGKDGISLSTLPGFYQPHVQIVPRGQVVYVVSGPERVDNIWWWLVRTADGVQGWGNQDTMLAVAGPCTGNTGSSTAPWPVTILPPGAVPLPGQPAVVPVVPVQTAPTATATPGQSEALPQTGSGLDWWFPALILLVVVVVVGVMRRRLQMQPVPDHSTDADDPAAKP